jgi:hypothetical protein
MPRISGKLLPSTSVLLNEITHLPVSVDWRASRRYLSFSPGFVDLLDDITFGQPFLHE